MSPPRGLTKAESALREHALGYPEVVEQFPWGHRAMKVRSKSFAFLALGEEALSLSVKLPRSCVAALTLPFASPTGYGLGKSGWVTARFEGKAKVPVALLCQWIDESYRAIAPKRVVASLDDRAGESPRQGTRGSVRRTVGKASPKTTRTARRRSRSG